MKTALEIEIMRLLTLAELALEKVEFNWNGTKVLNPQMQSVYTRNYNKAYNMKGEMPVVEFNKLYREVVEQMRNAD